MQTEEAKWKLLGSSNVFEKGGSKATIIPHKVVKYLKLSARDKLLFIVDTKSGNVIIGTEEHFGGLRMGARTLALGFPLSTKELEEIMKKFKGRTQEP
jgi:bifunctional DNA-binding transcriptional regulator/antitoxin component of YhaV-PrlF toxin-antitoxin module